MTEEQKEVFDAIETDGWFFSDEVMHFKSNKTYSLVGLAQKGFLEYKFFRRDSSDPNGLALQFRKVKADNASQ